MKKNCKSSGSDPMLKAKERKGFVYFSILSYNVQNGGIYIQTI